MIFFSGLFVEQREEFRILVTFPIAIVFPSSRSEKRPSCCMVSKVSMHTGRERVKRAITMLLLFTKRGCFFCSPVLRSCSAMRSVMTTSSTAVWMCITAL